VTRPKVLGIPSPWSGDEHDQVPWTYRPWVLTYWAVRRIRHRLRMHDWRPRGVDGGKTSHCDWCGANRRNPDA
jgi:hypothetical protein